MESINVYKAQNKLVSLYPIEYVERKGLGHPDSLIDGIVEKVSYELSNYYIKEAGFVLHHNVDKGLIVGGSSKVGLGSGKITKPIEVIIAGRATSSINGKTVPINEIAEKAVKEYLKENTRFLDINNDVVITSKIFPGSEDLNQIFNRSKGIPLANDTSFGMGFAPFTKAENLTLHIEKFLNSKEYKAKMPMTGEDIKVMCIRKKDKFTINVAIAFIAQLINTIEEYASLKEQIINDIRREAKKIIGDSDCEISINSGDNLEKKEIYLTKSGLSCESGDDGEVGRGNRLNGLITPFRTMTLEAAAGKNPINHTGKLYSVLSNEIAENIIKEYNQVEGCTVSIVSYIGKPINEPKNISILVNMKKGEKLDTIKNKIQDIATERLNNIKEITDGFIKGKYEVF
ncbi:MAG: methionine adenosyltransferase [Candidatus Micrarchaeia archaeon]